MKSFFSDHVQLISTSLAIAATAFLLASCGKPADTTGLGGGGGTAATTSVTLQSHPLAGPNAASLMKPGLNLATLLSVPGDALSLILGINTAHAAVSAFTSLTACNDTFAFLDVNGNPITVNGNAAPTIGQGLLTFSNSSVNPMTIGMIAIPTGTVISEIDITFAVKPSLCGGANYAVEFNDGVHGVIDVTQNTAFKFKFPAGGTQIVGSSQTVDLKLGAIVNAMATLGAGLNNASIQTINVGQAQ